MITSVNSVNVCSNKSVGVQKRPSFGAVINTFVCHRPDNSLYHYPVTHKASSVLRNLVTLINKNGSERSEILAFLKEILKDLKVDKPLARSTRVADKSYAKKFGFDFRFLLTGEQAKYVKNQAGPEMVNGYDSVFQRMLELPKNRISKDGEEMALLVLTSGEKHSIDGIQLRPLKQFLGQIDTDKFLYLVNREPVVSEVFAPLAPPVLKPRTPSPVETAQKAVQKVVQYAQCLLL